MIKADFYDLGLDDGSRFGAAVPEGEEEEAPPRIFRGLFMGPGRIEQWEEQRLILNAADFSDIMKDARGPRMCSDRLKNIVDSLRDPDLDFVEWLPATVTHEGGESRPYWYAYFPVWPDVMDEARSTFSSDGVPLDIEYDPEKLKGRTIFRHPDPYRMDLIVSKAARDAIIEAGCEGLTMSPEYTFPSGEYRS